MYLVLGILWLVGALAVFAWELATGQVRWRLPGFNVSFGWALLLLAAYNFVRWYGRRTIAAEDGLDHIRAARLRQAQRRERPEPDPAFDFSDRPPQAPPPS